MSCSVAHGCIPVPAASFLLMERNGFVMLLRCNEGHAEATCDHPGPDGSGPLGLMAMFCQRHLKEWIEMKLNARATMPMLPALVSAHASKFASTLVRPRRSRSALAFAAACAASLALAAGGAFAQGADPAVARLGAITIGQAEVERMLQAMPAAERTAVRGNRAGLENWLRQRVAGEALAREAQGKNWAARPEVKSRIDEAVKEVTARIVTSTYLASVAQLPAGYPSDAEVAAAYEQAKPTLNLPTAYRVSQIYLATPPGADAAAVAKVRDEAGKLTAQARTGDFAALAKSRSQDASSAERGGDVGAIPLEQMLPEMRDPVSKLKPGQVAGPVQSSTGFHIVKLAEVLPARTATLEEVKPRLQLALREQRQQQLVRDYMAQLAPAASVTIDGAALDAALQKTN